MRAILSFSLSLCFALSALVAKPPQASNVDGFTPPQLVSKGPKWKTVEQLRQFAAQGDPQACFELGDRLLNGDGMTADPAAARSWLDQAARGGVTEAMFRLGKMNFDGVGGPKSIDLALDYYAQAAVHGVPEAQHNIGAILVSGRGVKRDYPEGLAWLIVAERSGAASNAVARTREHLAKRPADIAAAEKRAAEIIAALADPAQRASAAPRFSTAGARPTTPPPIAEPKPEAPAKVKVDLGPGFTPPKPEVTLPKS